MKRVAFGEGPRLSSGDPPQALSSGVRLSGSTADGGGCACIEVDSQGDLRHLGVGAFAVGEVLFASSSTRKSGFLGCVRVTGRIIGN